MELPHVGVRSVEHYFSQDSFLPLPSNSTMQDVWNLDSRLDTSLAQHLALTAAHLLKHLANLSTSLWPLGEHILANKKPAV